MSKKSSAKKNNAKVESADATNEQQPDSWERDPSRAAPAVPPGFTGPRSVDLDAIVMPPLWMIVVACVFIFGALLAPSTVPRLGRLSMAAIGLSFLINFVPSKLTVFAIMGIAFGMVVFSVPAAGIMFLVMMAGYVVSRVTLDAAKAKGWGPLHVSVIYAVIWGVAVVLLTTIWRFLIESDLGADAAMASEAFGSVAKFGIGGTMAGFVGGLLTSTVGGVVVPRPSREEVRDALRAEREAAASAGNAPTATR